jgi:uncharacterized protein (DUF1800 family)
MREPIDPRWAWEPYRPTPQSPWDLTKVGHLYRRAGFGATWPELERGIADGPERAVNEILAGGPPDPDFDRLVAETRSAVAAGNNGEAAAAWWLYRMLYGRHPLREKLTLFWHNHFATSNAKVQNASDMLAQYDLLHRHALGHFSKLLREMSTDRAMMVWLDTALSKKGMPNENYARELMELFSLGIGNYTETDVREAARAFTGWSLRSRPDMAKEVVFTADQHDDGVKDVLGQSGRWKPEDIVRICLEQKSAPFFIVGKLVRFFVSETVPLTPELLEPLAEQYRKSEYDTGALVGTILRSNLFFSPAAYRTCVKSPVDFTLGIVRALEGRLGTTALSRALEGLGQHLFYPPSVKGWDGGQAWLNGQTLLFRQNLALALTSTEDSRFGRRSDPAALARKYAKESEASATDFFLRLFLQDDLPAEARARLAGYQETARTQAVPVYWTAQDAIDHRLRTLCHLVLTLSEFQLL